MEVKEEQLDFSDWEHSPVKKQTRKEKFLWQVEAGYPSQTAGEAAGAFLSPNGTPRRKAALATGTMVRIHWMQNWCSLSDATMEDALIDAPSAALPELILRKIPFPMPPPSWRSAMVWSDISWQRRSSRQWSST